MKAFVCKTSDGFFTSERGMEREFDSIDEALETLMEETHEGEFVVSVGGRNNVDWTIEIYDDYRE